MLKYYNNVYRCVIKLFVDNPFNTCNLKNTHVPKQQKLTYYTLNL